MHRFGRIPAPGDTFTQGDLTVTVTHCDGPRVVEVEIRKKTAE
jgi:CBS domain containing-hemolysin-like protein